MSDTAQQDSNSVKPDNATYYGAIRRLISIKGCGFIAGDDGIDYFFHWTGMASDAKDYKELVLRERVSYQRTKTAQGWRAVNIRCPGSVAQAT